jgi:hypothetical protein
LRPNALSETNILVQQALTSCIHDSRRIAGKTKMLDLETIFDPDRTAPTSSSLFKPNTPAPDAALTPADLPGDWYLEWDERAAIMEIDGGLPREQAEALALTEVVARMRQTPNQAECPCPACVWRANSFPRD